MSVAGAELTHVSAVDTEACLSVRVGSEWGSPLSWERVEESLIRYGKNNIELEQVVTLWRLLVNSLVHPFNILLTSLAVVSAITQDYQAPVVLGTMICISVTIRVLQERKSTTAAQALRSMVKTKAIVIRKYKVPDDRDPNWEDIEKLDAGVAQEYEVNMDGIVPGDIVKLSAGDMIPGDVQLIRSKDLFISQSMLTGESLPVEKRVDMSRPNITPVDDPANTDDSSLCFMGTSVVSGTATAVVLRTGLDTILGKLAKELSMRKGPNAFQVRIKRLSFMFVGIMLILVPIVFIIIGVRTGNWLDALLFGVAVAVGMTPEMLPMIVNGTLARGAYVMSKKRTIVKQLDAIINLGSLDILCTDKTGTLTQDKVVLMRHLDLLGRDAAEPLHLAFLNSYFQTGLKNLLDLAVVEHVQTMLESNPPTAAVRSVEILSDISTSMDAEQKPPSPLCDLTAEWCKVDEIPFDFVRRRISILLKHKSGNHKLITKGAVEEIVKIISYWDTGMGIEPISEVSLGMIQELAQSLNKEGLRVIAVATKDFASDAATFSTTDNADLEKDLTMMGFVAFLDPPKETCAAAIKELMRLGITVKVLTGDSPIVCNTVCKQVGLPVKSTVTSADLQGLDDEEFASIIEQGTVFAKLTPLEKSKVVSTLKRKHIVGFMGDGINDAAALKEADVGISVDTGVDVAKESASVILLEKSLLVLVHAILLGRITAGNTMKYLKMAVSSNFGNVLSVTVAALWLPFLPMLPIHLVVQNLLYDISQIAIPWDEMDGEYLVAPAQWKTSDLLRFMLFIGPSSSLFDILLFNLNYFAYGWNEDSGDNATHFQTGWFMLGLATQVSVVHMIRTAKLPFIQSRSSWSLLLCSAVIMAAAFLIPLSPLAPVLSMTPPPSSYFLVVLSLVAGYTLTSQLTKALYIALFHEWI